MTVLRSVLLFVVAALAEIGGAWLVWQGVREHRGLALSAPASSRWGPTGLSPPSNPTRTSAASWPPTAASSSPARSPGA
jgi:small multidrug resistance family-3 protein